MEKWRSLPTRKTMREAVLRQIPMKRRCKNYESYGIWWPTRERRSTVPSAS
jgi:hypothetical protein